VILWSKIFPQPKDTENLLGELRPFLTKALTTSAYNHFSLMLTMFSVRLNEEILGVTLANIREGMPVDFTPEEISQINLIFNKYGIRLQID